MRLIGTVGKQKNSNGMYMLTTRRFPIPLYALSDQFAGARVRVDGEPRWAPDIGSYFIVRACRVTNQPDRNDVVVEGEIVRIFPERKNSRNRRSACIMLRQRESETSSVLVTALSSNVDALQPDNLSIGTKLRIGGYISFHGRGLHVLYMKTIYKEEKTNA